MPHQSLDMPAVPPLIEGNGAIRTILMRVDPIAVAGGLRSFAPLRLDLPTNEMVVPSQPAAWASAVGDVAGRLRAALPAFVLGFAASLTVAVMVLAAVPELVTPVARTFVTERQTATMRDRLAQFAAVELPATAMAAPSAPVALKVAGEIVAEVGRSVPFPLAFEAEQRTASVRIGALPRYAGLSAGVPQEGGGWLVDAAAVPGLALTAYAAQPLPYDVDIELIGDDGKALASARTRVTVSAGPEVTTAEVPSPVPSRSAPMLAPSDVSSPRATAASPEIASVAAPSAEVPPILATSPRLSAAKPAPVRAAPAKPRVAAPAAKAARAAPKAPTEEKSAAIARAARLKPAIVPKPALAIPALIASAPSAVMMPSHLPWSYGWMRSTLGMGYNGP